jgi:hypothetical protein
MHYYSQSIIVHFLFLFGTSSDSYVGILLEQVGLWFMARLVLLGNRDLEIVIRI